MELERHRILSLTIYIVCTSLYLVGCFLIYSTFLRLNPYYLFITIPVFFLLLSLLIVNFIKIILTFISLAFGRNDNDEINNKIHNSLNNLNRLFKYVLIGIFITLLSSIMILDVILCINKSMYFILALSIVIWVLLYYVLFCIIIKIIKREIRL